MVKKSKEEVHLTEIDVAADIVETVAVDMTPEQRDEFVEFMRSKKSDEEKEARKGNLLAIRLSYKHNINGKSYGPGREVVPEEISGQLMYADYNQKQQEIGLHMSSKRLYQIFNEGNQVPMPVNAVKGVNF